MPAAHDLFLPISVVTKSLTQKLTRIFILSFHLQLNSWDSLHLSVYPPANCLNIFKREIWRYLHLVINSLLLATWFHLPLWGQCLVGLFSPLAAYFYCEKKKKMITHYHHSCHHLVSLACLLNIVGGDDDGGGGALTHIQQMLPDTASGWGEGAAGRRGRGG